MPTRCKANVSGVQKDLEYFKILFESFEKEIKEHDIYGLREKAKRKYDMLSSRTSKEASRLRRKINEYNRYIVAYEEIKRIYALMREGKKYDFDCALLLDAHDIWHEEISKYKVGWMKRYKTINDIYDDIMKNLCRVE